MLGVHRVDKKTAEARSKLARSVRTAGTSLLLAATASCPSTVPLAWSQRGHQVRADTPPAPRPRARSSRRWRSPAAHRGRWCGSTPRPRSPPRGSRRRGGRTPSGLSTHPALDPVRRRWLRSPQPARQPTHRSRRTSGHRRSPQTARRQQLGKRVSHPASSPRVGHRRAGLSKVGSRLGDEVDGAVGVAAVMSQAAGDVGVSGQW